jgi:excisionase family DNA binding protein
VRALSGDAHRSSGIRAAGRAIGLSASRVRELIDSGLLAVHPHRPQSAIRIPVQAIQELEDRLAKAVCPPPEDAKEFIRLGKALRYQIPPGHFGALLARILEGSAPAYFEDGAKGKFDRLMVRTTDFCFATSAGGGSSTLSIPDAADCLSVKQEVAYSLVRNGHLRAQRRRVGMRHSTRINRSAVDDFLKRYVSAAEIARMRNTSPRAVISLLTAAGIHPVTGPSVDGCRQAFYLRRAVKARRIAKRQ